MTANHQLPVSTVNFAVREKDGLFALDDTGNETRICDAIWHLGNAVDEDGNSLDVVDYIDRSGARRDAIIPHEDAVNHPGKVFDMLAKKYFAVPELELGRHHQPRRVQIVSYLDRCRRSPAREFLLVRRMGWHHHDSSFVIGNEVIPTEAAKRIKLTGPISQYAEKFGQGGSLADYQDKVLRRASYSSRLMAGIALALLAPVARYLGLRGGLNFVGLNGTGKTTIFRVIGSFYGGGPVDYFVTWNMTDNAAETLGLAFCDLPLLLDELDALEADSSKAGGRLKTIVHRLATGQGKTRSHHAPTDHSKSNDFHVIFGSTSEHRLPEFMRDGGSKVTGGQAVRFVDLPADAGRELKIFESLPRSSKSGRPPDVDRYLQRLNRACVTYYGVAGREYLRRLVDELGTDRSALESFLRKEMRTFEDQVANDPQVDHRIRLRFAGLYAAGQLGMRYGILHPRCDWFKDAIASCYWAAVALDAKSLLSATEAVACLVTFLRANRDRLLKVKSNGAITAESYRDAVGLIPDPAHHGKRVWLKSKVLQKSVFEPSAVSSAMTELGKSAVIVPSSRGLMAQQQRVPRLNIKDYFYVLDGQKLRALNGDKDRR